LHAIGETWYYLGRQITSDRNLGFASQQYTR
jgi:hypothetical protein